IVLCGNIVEQHLFQLRVPLLPRLTPNHVLGGGRVEIAVSEPLFAFAVVFEQVFRAPLDHLVVVEAAYLKRIERGGSSGKTRLTVGLIGETSTRRMKATPDVF